MLGCYRNRSICVFKPWNTLSCVGEQERGYIYIFMRRRSSSCVGNKKYDNLYILLVMKKKLGGNKIVAILFYETWEIL